MVKRIFNRRAWQEILFLLSLAGHCGDCHAIGLYTDLLWD